MTNEHALCDLHRGISRVPATRLVTVSDVDEHTLEATVAVCDECYENMVAPALGLD